MAMNHDIKVVTLRDAPYREVLERQRPIFAEMVARRRAGLPVGDEWLFLVEHRPVYTIGRNGHRENLIDPEFLRRESIELVDIERGGDITFHGPGQLVAYPIVDFGARRLGVKDYVNLLEQAVINVLEQYGIAGQRVEGATGVWLDVATSAERKICAIGVKCSRFVAMHGLALNVATDPAYFRAINPCGFVDRGVTSIAAELARASTPAHPDRGAASVFGDILTNLGDGRGRAAHAASLPTADFPTAAELLRASLLDLLG